MIYLASPYTSDDVFIMEERYLRAMRVLTWLLQQKKWAYSPIVHCHELAKLGGLPREAAFWKEYNFYMLGKCTEMKILRIDGWESSKGIAEELVEANRLNLPVTYI